MKFTQFIISFFSWFRSSDRSTNEIRIFNTKIHQQDFEFNKKQRNLLKYLPRDSWVVYYLIPFGRINNTSIFLKFAIKILIENNDFHVTVGIMIIYFRKAFKTKEFIKSDESEIVKIWTKTSLPRHSNFTIDINERLNPGRQLYTTQNCTPCWADRRRY